MAGGEGKPPRSRGNSGRDIAFEVEIGSRIRAARVAAGLTQRALGDAVGIAYQKLQKYELGQDRIAVSTLQRIARALGLHPGSFFGDDTPVPAGHLQPLRAAMAVASNWQKIRNPAVRKKIANLTATLAEEDRAEQERGV